MQPELYGSGEVGADQEMAWCRPWSLAYHTNHRNSIKNMGIALKLMGKEEFEERRWYALKSFKKESIFGRKPGS